MLIRPVKLDRLCGSMKIQNIILCDLSAVFKEVYNFVDDCHHIENIRIGENKLGCWKQLREISRKLICTKCGDDYDSKTI